MKKKKKTVKKPVKKKKIAAKKAKTKPAKKAKTIKAKKKVAAKQAKPAVKPSVANGLSLEEVGVITHYFPHVDAAVVKLTKGTLSLGDTIVIKGHTSDFKEKVDSIQLDHAPITNASVGQEIGLKVKSKVREHDVVYKVIG